MAHPPSGFLKRRRTEEASAILARPFVSPMRSRKPRSSPPDQRSNSTVSSLEQRVVTSASSSNISSTTASQESTVASTQNDQSIEQSYGTLTPTTTTSCTASHAAEPVARTDHMTLRQLQRKIQQVRNEIAILQQATEIGTSNSNDKLDSLVLKWRLAAQQAADEVFVTVKQRVDSMGGIKSWRREQRVGRDGHARQADYYWNSNSADTLNQYGHSRLDDATGLSVEELEGDVNGELDSSKRLLEYSDAGRVARSKELPTDDDISEEFTMALMLTSLNIDPNDIDYDLERQTWRSDPGG